MKLRLLTISILCSLFALDAYAQCPSGRIRNDATGSTRDIELCTGDGQADAITFRTDFQATTALATIITDDRGEILAEQPGQTFDFEGFANGESRAYILSYTGTLSATIGEKVYAIDLATGCFELSSNYIEIEHSAPVAGSITDDDGMVLASLCVRDGSPDYVGYDVTGADADRYVYLITDTDGNVEKVDYNTYEDFGYQAPGTSYIYGLAYSGSLKVRSGDNIFTDQLVDGCYDLTDNFIIIERNEVDGGRIRVDGEKHIKVDTNTTQAPLIDHTTSSVSPIIYVIIDDGNIIRGFSQGPAVDMSFLSAGKYWIYGFSYTGNIQAEVGQRIWDSGVRFASGCFSRSNAIVVTKKTPATTTAPCAAYAGNITAVASPVMLQNGIARIDAVQDGSAFVPSSYDSVYFLTVGPTEIIVALSISSPSFSVNTVDTFTVFYLNAEVTDSGSPDFIDLGAIQFGVTTMGDLAADIMDREICADLTIPGAEVIVLPDPLAPCAAFASSAIPVLATVPLVNGEATIDAIPDGGASLPANAELTFVLAQGVLQTIIALSDTPQFTVTEAGVYSVHPLAAETTDPTSLNFLDRRDWISNGLNVFGAYDVIFAEGICADIDFYGAVFQVTSGSSCAAASGSINVAADTVVLVNQTARISGLPDGNAVIPGSFDRTYVLSYGPNKIIQAISAIPRFDVSTVGDYFIHAWIGEFDDMSSVDYVNLSAIQQGIAPISDIVLQIQGSGICSSIDEAGAAAHVTPSTTAFALQLRPTQVGDYLRVGNAYASTPQQGKLIVSDQLGRVIASKEVQLSEQPQTFELEVLNANNGFYFLSLIGNTEGVISSQGVLLN
ncbi:MAG: hypothetical protein AB8F78_14730 [Saprospiraceae bacterium]